MQTSMESNTTGDAIDAVKGLRVLEVGEGLSGAFAGLILAAQGADVCQVRHGLSRRLTATESAFFDRGRLLLEEECSLGQLIGGADIVLCDLHPTELQARGIPIDSDDLDRLSPTPTVLVSVTDLGLYGPQAEFVMCDITTWAAGGLAYVTRRPVPDDDPRYVPVLAPGRQPEVLGGIAAATAAVAGVWLRRKTGKSVVAEVSRQEVIAAMLHGIVPPFVWNSMVRGAPGSGSHLGMLVPSEDGYVYIRTVEGHQWTSLMEWLGNPAWAKESWSTDPALRMANWSTIEKRVGEWTTQHPRQWLYEEGQKRRIPIALPRSLNEVLNAGQLRERGAWHHIDIGGVPTLAPRIPMLDTAEWKPSRFISTRELEREWVK